MLTLTQSLLDEAKYIKDDTRNESLKMFAIMTTAMVPLQFVAGYVSHTYIFTVDSARKQLPPIWYLIIGSLL